MKKHKSKNSSQISPPNGNAEIFVLPPDILAKLGINIQQSQIPATNLATGFEPNPVHNSPKPLRENKNASSIIETASLMKQSVFLSPTFNENTSNAMPVEIPINNSSSSSAFIICDNEHILNHSNEDNGNMAKDKSRYDPPIRDIIPCESIEEYSVENQNGNLVLTDVSNENNVDSKSDDNSTVMITHLQECTEDFILPDITEDSESFSEYIKSSNHKQDVPNKIQIISEEVIVDLSKLKEVANLKSSNDVTLIPISVDTIVKRKSVHNDLNTTKQILPRRLIKEEITDQITTKLNDVQTEQILKMPAEDFKLCQITEETDLIYINSKAKLKSEKISFVANKSEENANDLPMNNFLTNNRSNVIKTAMGTENIDKINHVNGDTQSDSVYLVDDSENVGKINEKMCCKQNNNESRVLTEEQKVNNNNEKEDNIRMCPANTVSEKQDIYRKDKQIPVREGFSQDKVNEIASYLKQIANLRNENSIKRRKSKESHQMRLDKLNDTHIVEDRYIVKLSKTYQRTSFHKQIPASISMSQKQQLDLFQMAYLNTRENPVVMLNGQNNFCVCYDFGNLSYYDCDVIDEHIHFLETRNTNCDAEILYSIYNDDCKISKQIPDIIEDENDNIQDNTTLGENTICWNDYQTEINYNNEDDSSDTKLFTSDFEIFDRNPSSEIITSTKPLQKDESNILEDDTKHNTMNNPKRIRESSIQSSKHNSDRNLSPGVTTQLTKTNSGSTKRRVSNLSSEILTKKIKTKEKDISLTSNEISNKNVSLEKLIAKAIDENVKDINDSPNNLQSLKERSQYTSVTSNKKSTNDDSVERLIAITIDKNITKGEKYPKSSKQTSKSLTSDLPVKCSKNKEAFAKQIAAKIVETVEGVTENKTDTVKELPNKQSIPFDKDSGNIICGVCKKDIKEELWLDHITKEHDYLAWREGDPELNLEDEEQIRTHLQNIAKQLGGLVCSKCGLNRKFARKYLSHIKNCANGLNDSTASELNSTVDNEDDEVLSVIKSRKPRNRKSVQSEAMVKCGVCNKSVPEPSWIKHIQTEHKYLAWKDGETPLDLNSEDDVKNHLNVIAKTHGLTCNKCGTSWRYVKKYLLHDGICEAKEDKEKVHGAEYECGVCHEKGNVRDWTNHAMKVHYNIAWMADEEPINLKDLNTIDKRLKEYKMKYNFICNKCKAARASSHGFYIHIMTCGKTEEEIDLVREECEICSNKYLCVYKSQHMIIHKEGQSRKTKRSSRDCHDDSRAKKSLIDGVNIKQEMLENRQQDGQVEVEIDPLLKCGVCKKDVVAKDWINHIQREHAYLAWIVGEEPLDVDDPEKVREHLIKIINSVGELVCNKCGAVRKHEHGYRQHLPACDKTGFKIEITVPLDLKKDEYECAVCQERGYRSEFKEHAMKIHYNIAWMAGEIPINVKNFYAVEKYLKEYQSHYQLICKVCKASRTSCYGFYAHILQCGKSEQELDALHNICDICNKKYLCIYRNQHIAMHRERVYRNDLKKMQELKKAEEAERKISESSPSTRKRKAAVKASRFIKKHSSVVHIDGKLVCSCGKIFSSEAQLSGHRCRDAQDSDVSVKTEAESEDSESEVDSNVSADEDKRKEIKRVRSGEGATKIQRMSFRVNNYSSHLDKGFRDFSKLHYASENLFEEWRNSEYPLVPPEEIDKYLPPIKESCKVRFGSGEWKTFKRFESNKSKGVCIFTGGAIQCISWAPLGIDRDVEDHYLCVVSHRGGDVTRCSPADRGRDYSLLQIWRFGDFATAPHVSVALALDCGVVWAIDWCPSGARDSPESFAESTEAPSRLGLLAVACSDGSAYIFAVPYPTENTELEKITYKPKPVAELRISMGTGRRIYQATSINWSHQKGHKIIIVGYSDGTTALYDLNTESPLLRGNENGVHIFYPFQDRLSENSAINGAVLIPTHNPHQPTGSVCTSSVTGGTVRACVHAAPAARSHMPAAASKLAPLWPALHMYGDGALTANIATELEWWGGGRRLGSAQCGASCFRCGRLATLCSPAVRLLRSHPVYPELKKLIIATLVMVPLGHKGKRKVKDDLSMVVEPLSYEEAVNKYGLELSYVSKKEQAEAQKLCSENEFSPERFPLSEMVAAEFCPSSRYHDKLAIASHSGLVFLIHT